MSERAASLSHLLGPLRRSLLRAAQGAGDLPDIPDAQIELLRTLAQSGGATPGALATELGLARSTVSNLVKTMAASGLVDRSLSDSDGRSTVLSPSPAALALLDRYDRASATLLDEVFDRLSADERARIDRALPVLQRLRDELGRRA
ncbi:DNA-binding transcriptional regulator, MarR family [Curtobacterium sp. UNCCL20]|uniref:MarR family winged helix-turn-helix transcriptional regulator n=1 Tax=Curtobacterium sp. UNCCL20 TaxID=1502773 RepID=UPI000886EA65|nr:MarR family transcriptional regulator [Curtobacterium sp. UNCCL20]SDQ12601.1 DNA-binding transcriptional regulator, MarR family [Curtobacterium sp. UNCCL20]